MITITLPTNEYLAIIEAAQAAFDVMERNEDENENSFMAYTDNGNFLYSLSTKQYEDLKKALEKR